MIVWVKIACLIALNGGKNEYYTDVKVIKLFLQSHSSFRAHES